MKTLKSTRLSASLVKDYIACPKRVYYRLYEPEQGIGDRATGIGIVMHELIEKYWKSSNAMASHIKETMFKHHLNSGIEDIGNCIRNFEKFRPYLYDGDIIERFFTYPYKDVTIVGKMDRITKDGIIFDWKTGKSKPDNLSRDPQFILYYLSYKKLYGKRPKAVYYASLSTGTLHMFIPNDNIISEFETSILPDILRQVKEKHFPRYGLYGYKVCNYCSYSDQCFKELDIDE